jgi:Domain of unknown function (DUF6532)
MSLSPEGHGLQFARSYAVLFASLAAHAVQFAFFVFFENPYIAIFFLACDYLSSPSSCLSWRTTSAVTPKSCLVLSHRGSHTRRELKTKACPIVEAFCGFENGHNRKIIAKNRELAEGLKDRYGYAYKVSPKIVDSCYGFLTFF